MVGPQQMAEVVFRRSSFPNVWPWTGFQFHGRIVSPFSPCKDFSLSTRFSRTQAREQCQRRTVTQRFDASSLTKSPSSPRLVALLVTWPPKRTLLITAAPFLSPSILSRGTLGIGETGHSRRRAKNERGNPGCGRDRITRTKSKGPSSTCLSAAYWFVLWRRFWRAFFHSRGPLFD